MQVRRGAMSVKAFSRRIIRPLLTMGAHWGRLRACVRACSHGPVPVAFGRSCGRRAAQYFGEIVLWTGMYVAALPGLHSWQHVAAVSPVFIAFLLTRVSGVPILERQAQKRWGAAYEAHCRTTPVLFPFFG